MNNADFQDLKLFKSLMADMPAAVTVITAWGSDGRPVGATLSAVMSLSLEPPMMLAAFDRASSTLDALNARGRPFLIHVLADDQHDIAQNFAGKGADKFKDIDWTPGLLGLPELPGVLGTIACEVAELVPGGDHVVIMGAIREVQHRAQTHPLIYHRRALHSVAAYSSNIIREASI